MKILPRTIVKGDTNASPLMGLLNLPLESLMLHKEKVF